eukprot:971394-Pleurochrysis_carterae.AAC.1
MCLCKFISPAHARFVCRRRSHDVRVSACIEEQPFRRAPRHYCVRMSLVGDMAVFNCIRTGLHALASSFPCPVAPVAHEAVRAREIRAEANVVFGLH